MKRFYKGMEALKQKKVPFKKSKLASIGTELELQIIENHHYTLAQRSKDLIRNLKEGPHKKHIKPEITQGMIEITSTIHTTTPYYEGNNSG